MIHRTDGRDGLRHGEKNKEPWNLSMERHKTLTRMKFSLILEATAADGTDVLTEQSRKNFEVSQKASRQAGYAQERRCALEES